MSQARRKAIASSLFTIRTTTRNGSSTTIRTRTRRCVPICLVAWRLERRQRQGHRLSRQRLLNNLASSNRPLARRHQAVARRTTAPLGSSLHLRRQHPASTPARVCQVHRRRVRRVQVRSKKRHCAGLSYSRFQFSVAIVSRIFACCSCCSFERASNFCMSASAAAVSFKCRSAMANR